MALVNLIFGKCIHFETILARFALAIKTFEKESM